MRALQPPGYPASCITSDRSIPASTVRGPRKVVGLCVGFDITGISPADGIACRAFPDSIFRLAACGASPSRSHTLPSPGAAEGATWHWAAASTSSASDGPARFRRSWSSLTADKVDEAATSGQTGSARVKLPGVVTLATQPVRADATASDGLDATSVMSVAVGALSCSAEDAR